MKKTLACIIFSAPFLTIGQEETPKKDPKAQEGIKKEVRIEHTPEPIPIEQEVIRWCEAIA